MGRGGEVITGLRSPDQSPGRDPGRTAAPPVGEKADLISQTIQSTREAARPADPHRRPGERVFGSRYSNARLQVKMASDRYDIATGTLVKGETKFAQFSGGILKTSDPEVIAAITAHKGFGKDTSAEYWDVDELRVEKARRDIDALISTIEASPELAGEVRSRLLKKDPSRQEFDLPPAAGPDSQQPPA